MESNNCEGKKELDIIVEQQSSSQDLQLGLDYQKVVKKGKKIVINIRYTQYEIIKQIAKQTFRWKISHSEDDEDWDLQWIDTTILTEKLQRMKPYQKVNHFPEMYRIYRKNCLAKNIKKMRKLYPKEYNFAPKTWIIPTEYFDFRNQLQKDKNNRYYILKPPDQCQGRDDLQPIDPQQIMVAQKYIKNPLLIDGHKFDLRIYVLMIGCDPLKLFLHKEGLCRLATEYYLEPNQNNQDNQFMHLTNYSINKFSHKFLFNLSVDDEDKGHKRSLEEYGVDCDLLIEKLKDIVVKTIILAQPSISHVYRSCQPDDITNSMCFEILGFDILIDQKHKPWLLEVNHSPSFSIDTPLDKRIKKAVIQDSLSLINVSHKNRKKYHQHQMEIIRKRMISMLTRQQRQENKEEDIKNYQVQRQKYEQRHIGGFTQIFPASDAGKQELYNQLLLKSKEIFLNFQGSKVNKSKRDQIQIKIDEQKRMILIQKQKMHNKVLSKQSQQFQPVSQKLHIFQHEGESEIPLNKTRSYLLSQKNNEKQNESFNQREIKQQESSQPQFQQKLRNPICKSSEKQYQLIQNQLHLDIDNLHSLYNIQHSFKFKPQTTQYQQQQEQKQQQLQQQKQQQVKQVEPKQTLITQKQRALLQGNILYRNEQTFTKLRPKKD